VTCNTRAVFLAKTTTDRTKQSFRSESYVTGQNQDAMTK
jgi:hypothetical protein